MFNTNHLQRRQLIKAGAALNAQLMGAFMAADAVKCKRVAGCSKITLDQ